MRDGDRSPNLARRSPSRLAFLFALSVIGGALCAAPAFAQQAAPMKPIGAAPVAPADQPVVFRAEGGVVFCCAETGFLAGANVSAHPHALEGVEVAGDATVGRFGGFGLLYFSADGLYAVPVSTFKVFGGGGIGIAKTTGGGPTNTGAQLIAGVELPWLGRHRIRVEARFLFLPAETTLLIGSISF